MEISQASSIYTTCLIVILFWDYLNTLYSEIRYVWIPLFSSNQRAQWRKAGTENRLYMLLSPVLFFVLRYLALIEFAIAMGAIYGTISPSTCNRLQHLFPLGSVIVALAASAMMALRVVALWENALMIKLPLLIVYVITAVLAIWGATFTKALQGSPVCLPVQTSDNINAFYLSICIFDAIVVVLTLLRAFRVRRQQFDATGYIFGVMVRDGLIYFVLIFTANLLAAVFELQTANELLRPINATLATVITSIFGARIYFNIRAEVYKLRNPRAHFAGYADELDLDNTSGSERSDRASKQRRELHSTQAAGMLDRNGSLEEGKAGVLADDSTEPITEQTSRSSSFNNKIPFKEHGFGGGSLLRSNSRHSKKSSLAANVKPVWAGGSEGRQRGRSSTVDDHGGITITSQQETSLSPPDQPSYAVTSSDKGRSSRHNAAHRQRSLRDIMPPPTNVSAIKDVSSPVTRQSWEYPDAHALQAHYPSSSLPVDHDFSADDARRALHFASYGGKGI